MNKSVTIVDYGVGNLRSVARAFEFVGASVKISSDFKEIEKSERLVLPGVGAFGHCIGELKNRELINPIIEFANSGKLFLGICVGMQLLLTAGEEFGEHDGLNLIQGRVKSIPKQGANGKKHILPSVNWKALEKTDGANWQGTILGNTEEGEQMYFIHSFAAYPDSSENLLAVYQYEDTMIPAVIAKDNVFGVQFHPEKSGKEGLKIISHFVNNL